MQRTLPMFPLGNVLVPHALLPLHVFEPLLVIDDPEERLAALLEILDDLDQELQLRREVDRGGEA